MTAEAVRWRNGGSTDGCLTQPSGGDEAEATVGEEMSPGCTRNLSCLVCQRTGTARSSWHLRDGVVWKMVVIDGGLLVVVTAGGGCSPFFSPLSLFKGFLPTVCSPATALSQWSTPLQRLSLLVFSSMQVPKAMVIFSNVRSSPCKIRMKQVKFGDEK